MVMYLMPLWLFALLSKCELSTLLIKLYGCDSVTLFDFNALMIVNLIINYYLFTVYLFWIWMPKLLVVYNYIYLPFPNK
jgi:hypothetical protein